MNGRTEPDSIHDREPAFVHAALIAGSDDSLRRQLIPMLTRCLDRDEPVLMVVGASTARVVRAGLGALADRLEWGDSAAFYQRLGFAYEQFRRYLAAQHAQGRRVHVISEPDIGGPPGGPVDRVAAYLSYESVCNEVFAAYGCSVTCLWDSRRHPTLVVEGVRSLHSHEITAGGTVVNDAHVSTVDYLAGRNAVPMAPPPGTTDFDVTLTDPGQSRDLRPFLYAWATGRSFDPAAAGDVVIAVTEVVVNGFAHGAAPVRVRAWHQTATLVVQVDDAGGTAIPPAAGYLPPGEDPAAARGLWLARQLADVVTTHTSAGVTSVRLHFPDELTHRTADF